MAAGSCVIALTVGLNCHSVQLGTERQVGNGPFAPGQGNGARCSDRDICHHLHSRPKLSEKFLTWVLVFSPSAATIDLVIRKTGAPSIAMGRTPHELHDEMSRRMRSFAVQ